MNYFWYSDVVEVRYNVNLAHELNGEQIWKVSICLFGRKMNKVSEK